MIQERAPQGALFSNGNQINYFARYDHDKTFGAGQSLAVNKDGGTRKGRAAAARTDAPRQRPVVQGGGSPVARRTLRELPERLAVLFDRPDLRQAFPLHVDHLRSAEGVSVAQRAADLVRDRSPVGRADSLHAACRVHRIAPDIEGELRLADDAGGDWSGMHAYSQRQ